MFARLFAPTPSRFPPTATFPCGVYDPAQARIEAESIKAHHRQGRGQRRPRLPHPRHALIKEQRSELVKHHLLGAVDRLLQASALREVPPAARPGQRGHQARGASGTKGRLDAGKADELLAKIDEIAEIFWETKKA